MKKYRIRVNGEEYEVEVEEIKEGGEKQTSFAEKPPVSSAPAAPKTQEKKKAVQSSGVPGEVKAPMSGKVLKVGVKTGDEVTKGQVLMILEAMKMENEITANTDGKIKEIKVNEGASVNPGDILVILE